MTRNKRLLFLLTILTVLLWSFAVSAQPTPANTPAAEAEAPATDGSDPYKDWNTTMALLASQGIDPLTINWSQMDAPCADFKSGGDQHQYNKCCFEKARDNFLFANDKSQCTTRAQGAFPDGLLRGRTDTLTETDKSGVTHTYQRTIPALSTSDLQQQRAAVVTECMQNLGWVNSNDWHFGRRSNYAP